MVPLKSDNGTKHWKAICPSQKLQPIIATTEMQRILTAHMYIYSYGHKIIYSWTDWWGPPENSWACNCMTNGTYEGVDDDVVKEAKLNHSTLFQVSMKLCNPMIIDKTSTLQHLENPKLIRFLTKFHPCPHMFWPFVIVCKCWMPQIPKCSCGKWSYNMF